ncbi:U3 snoRNP protein [Vermiconidia calcicola]|uniref:U3 snoRNP protein n=1 Tax=Vermiconidia calcicola TaxID=1690605 RepID=A0ACC3MLT2_9PEZI|nr:U3 snoRNP protein [Vermiconidia calcicola]
MAGASDKARFYLEQYVPELQEYERKEIFTREEITSITSKRSGFEHTLNARGSRPSDYARYATYEMNLDSLRKKRCKRLGVKSTAFNGQRTIFFILDRATKKFPGDMGLWMQYIHFCQKEKANKKLAKVFTKVLRLKPREWGLWVLAAKHYAESQGDMSTARSYMQRGLRFCKDEVKLWLEYTRLEMVYLAKLAARRRILGLDGVEKPAQEPQAEEDEDMLTLPTITAEDIDPDARKGIEEVDDDALKRLASAPAFSGAIPIAIFDAAMKQFSNGAEEAEAFFDLCATFKQVPSTMRILQHILDHMQEHTANCAETAICTAKLSLLNVEAESASFPLVLGQTLSGLKRNENDLPYKAIPKLAEKAVEMYIPYLEVDSELDEDVMMVLQATDPVAAFVEKLRKEGRDADAQMVEDHRNSMDLG